MRARVALVFIAAVAAANLLQVVLAEPDYGRHVNAIALAAK